MTKLFKQEEVDEAALEYSKNAIPSIPATKSKLLNIEIDFRAGIKFAESKIEEIAVEFAEWVAERYTLSIYKEWCSLGMPTINSTKELFKRFLKERNEKV